MEIVINSKALSLNSFSALSRRGFLKSMLASGVLVISGPYSYFGNATTATNKQYLGLVSISRDNVITIFNPNPELGQGTLTSLPMLIAEELDAEWSKVEISQLPLSLKAGRNGKADWAFVAQYSGGSASVRRFWLPLRYIGARTRQLFVNAAAKVWDVEANSLQTKGAIVFHSKTGQKASYGELISEAAKLPIPSEADTQLKEPHDFKIIGTRSSITAGRDIVTGKPIFGIDQDLPGMMHAVILRCPYLGGDIKTVDDHAARAVPGVRDIVIVPGPKETGTLETGLAAGVAVVADTLWAAMKGRSLLKVTWDKGPNTSLSTEQMVSKSEHLLGSPNATIRREEGNFEEAYANAATKHEATYYLPYVAHVTMEPHSCVADVRANGADIILSCQHPRRIAEVAERITGLDPLSVHVQVARAGGAFGRKFETDYPGEAIYISHKLGKPVKVTWTREDDIQHDRYRNFGLYRMQGGLDKRGRLMALSTEFSGPAIENLRDNWDRSKDWGNDIKENNFPKGMVKNICFKDNYFRSPVPTGPWRAPGYVNSAIPQQCFLDEIARMAGDDPIEFQIKLLDTAKKNKPMMSSSSEYDFDPERAQNVIRLAAKKARMKTKPKGGGRGFAFFSTFYSYVAHVIDVVVEDGTVNVKRVVSAVDIGQVVNPLGVEAQVQGCIHDGLSVALGQEITIKDGQIVQSNFDDYKVMRIDQAPEEIEVHIIDSNASPTGIGEPPIPPFTPALLNAIYDATGKRIRKLPIANQLVI